MEKPKGKTQKCYTTKSPTYLTVYPRLALKNIFIFQKLQDQITGESRIKSYRIKQTYLEDPYRKNEIPFHVCRQKPQIDLLLNCLVIPSLIPSLFHCKLAVVFTKSVHEAM